MSGRPAIIRQRDATRLLKAAADAGITMGIVVRNGEAVFLPVDLIAQPVAALPPASEDDALDRELAEFAEKHGYGRA